MSNIAGKAYAMNVVTPIKWYMRWLNKTIFWVVNTGLLKLVGASLNGLLTLSLIHYARWTIVKPSQFPRLDPSQPEEDIKYSYMFFFSNFNGSWAQYVDSFHTSIPTGLDLFWFKNIKYPKSVPLQPFHDYITYNQVWTNHYYNAYPMASSNDVKAAKKVKDSLLAFMEDIGVSAGDSVGHDASSQTKVSAEEFMEKYNKLLLGLQGDIGLMAPTPIVSLSAEAVEQRRTLIKVKKSSSQAA